MTGLSKEISYASCSCYVLSYSRFIATEEETDMPTKRKSFLSRLVRALPVVLAAAPGVIDAIQQARRALSEPAAPERDPSLPPA
jgi:hypothetical protein